MSKISGPLMDRIDIQIDVPAVPYKELANSRAAESSETIRIRVVAARNVQLRRFFDDKIYTNAQMGPRHLRKYCVLTPIAKRSWRTPSPSSASLLAATTASSKLHEQ
jgi:magnesium chelatase family protein